MQGVTFRRHHRMRGITAVVASVAFVGGTAAACGSSVSSSPAGVVTTLFSDIQANNCGASFAQLSSRLQGQLQGRAGICPLVTQLARRYRNNKFHIDSVVTHGNEATVRATRTNTNGTSVSNSIITVVDKNAWKVDSLA
ncbi:MAG: hypothetical protein E6G01_07775 [Actinobacteria bacterium]|nr:MAG: hypothetical protein E6G01_07775 [Actinomycetota bacterium]